MCEHGALGDAGRAAGIQNEGGVFSRSGRSGPERIRSDRLAEKMRLGQFVGRNHFPQVFRRQVDQRSLRFRQQVSGTGDDDVFDIYLFDDAFKLVAEGFEHDHGFRAGIGELVLHFRRRIERIGGDDDEIGLDRRVDHDRKLQQVRQLYRDPVAGIHLQSIAQKAREAAAQLIDFAITQTVAEAVEGRQRAMGGGNLVKHLGQ